MRDLNDRLRAVLPLRIVLGPGLVQDSDGAAVEIDEGMGTLVTDLYRDGVRELRFAAALARPELDRLVAGLAAPRDSQDLTEDYVTRLWEAELPNVSLIALDPYLDRDIPGDVLEGKERPSGEAEGLNADAPQRVPPPPDEAFRLSALDRQNLNNELAQATSLPPWPVFVAALLEIAATPVASRRAGELLAVFEATLYRLVSVGQLALATEFLRRGLAELRLPGEPMKRLIERASQADRLAAVRDAVERDPAQQPAARDFVHSLAPASLPALVEFLRSAASTGARRFWSETLALLGEKGLAALEQLAADPDSESAAAAARVLSTTGNKRYLPALWRGFEQAAGPLRREILRSVVALDAGASAARSLEVALGDSDPDCRLIALAGVSKARDDAAEQRLLARLTAAGADLPDREQDALYRALSLAGGPRAAAFIGQHLAGGWFSGADRAAQTRAARALARMSTPEARELLRERAEGRGALAEICQRALHEQKGREP